MGLSKIFVLVIVFPLLLFAADPIGVVQYPLTSRPALVRAGDSFDILCNAPPTTSGWNVKLLTPYNTLSPPVSAVFDNTRNLWVLTCSLPADTPFELYDLTVSASGVADRVSHAVKVVTEFKSSYYFVHLPDVHLPSVSWIGYYDDKNTIPEFKRIVDELEVINPEFVVQTGDIVDNGQSEQQYQIVQDLFSQLSVPMFVTGGNHDLWYNGHTFWHKYISPVMDYSFNYGQHHFTGIEMFDIPTVTFTADQMRWLQTDLSNSVARGEKMRTLFYHYDESRQITSDFADDFQLDLILYGHTHINGTDYLGSRNALNLNTSFTMNDNGEYRLIKVSGDRVQSFPVIKYKKLNVFYSPANDGSNSVVGALIQNNNPVSFENGLLKFLVKKEPAGYSVSGGEIIQVIPSSSFDVYYVKVNINASSSQQVTLRTNGALANNPPQIVSATPEKYSQAVAGIADTYAVTARDPDGDALSYQWSVDGNPLAGSGASLSYSAPRTFKGLSRLQVKVSDGRHYDTFTWHLEVDEFTDKPRLITPVINFFPQNDPMTLEWVEPFPIAARFEYGLVPGSYTGSITETGNNSVTFTPSAQGMGLGKYYCRITDGNVSSDPFTIIVESSVAPNMLAPLGSIKDLSPAFTWERVPGVPYYMVICSDREIIILEDPETGDFSIEGANPIWAVLTPENSVPYGIRDPSNTYTSVPSPLVPGQTYWWVVLNVYGNSPELVSPVQSGFSQFTVDLPPPDMAAPFLVWPENNVILQGKKILFKWEPAKNASAYHFYPFKIENESGIETARAIWDDIISTTDTEYVLSAGTSLIEGKYRWRVASVAANGVELPSESRDFFYQAPSATITIHTYDNKNTPAKNSDDVTLPRVSIKYAAINGVNSTLPLSTDLHGARVDYKIAPGQYSFVVEKEQFDTIIDTLSFTEGESYQIDFRLSPSKSAVTGVVQDRTGTALSDAIIHVQHSLRSDLTRTARSDASGHFTASLIPGPYQIWAEKEDYKRSDSQSFSVESGATLSLASPLVLQKYGNEINGTVLNSENQPVYGVRVTASKSSTIMEKFTDINGAFKFQVESGSWTLHAEKGGFISPADQRVSVSGGQVVQISPPIILQPNAGIVQGRVSDGLRLLPGVTVTALPLAGSPFQTTSDEYGQFGLNLPGGTFQLTAEKENYTFSDNIQVTVAAGKTVSGVELRMSTAQSYIEGKVTTDGYTPLADVRVFNGGQNAVTGDGGSYILGVNYGTHIVTAFKEGFTSSPAETVTVAAGQRLQNVNYVLSPNASVIKGRVTSAGGAIKGATVEASGTVSRSVLSDEKGYYVLNLEAGEWTVSARKTGFSVITKPNIWVGTGQTTDGVNFDLPRNNATLQGTVTELGSGSPLRDVKVEVQENNLSSVTSADGTFLFVVEPSSYTLLFSKPGYKKASLASGPLSLNQTKYLQLSLEKLAGSFQGSVTDDSNAPVAGAEITAESASGRFSAVSGTNGKYRLDVKAGSYSISAQKSGYETNRLSGPFIVQIGDLVTLLDIQLSSNLGGIKGRVTESGSGTGVAQVNLKAVGADGFTALTKSGNNGNYKFVDRSGRYLLLPGLYSLSASKAGYSPSVVENIAVDAARSVTANIALSQNTGELRGLITANGNPVEGATITARHQTSGGEYQTISNPAGTFLLSGLPDGTYRVSVALIGYTSPDPQIAPINSAINFDLTKNSGRFSGTVTDKENQQPLSGAQIAVDDGFGNNGRSTTNASGQYEIRSLPQLYPYTVAVSRSGFVSQSAGPIAVTADTKLDFELERLYGNVSGLVVDENNIGLQGMEVKLQSGTNVRFDTTDAQGRFQFLQLAAQQYTLTVTRPGFISDPLQQIVSLWLGNTVTDVKFVMIQSLVAELKIKGPGSIGNNAVQKYQYSAVTADGRRASVDPQWTVDFQPAVDSIQPDGLLDPKNDFIGTVKIELQDRLTKVSAEKPVDIYQPLAPGHPRLKIDDQQGVQLVLQDSSVLQNVSIQLRRPQFAEVRRNNRSFKVVGDVFQFSPLDLPLLKPATLLLPVESSASGDKLQVGYWDTRWLEWKTMPDAQKLAGSYQVKINNLGTFAILQSSEPLGIRDVKVLPNPFSPLTGPAEITFDVTSDQTPTPEVTMKIFNMNGDLVKTLHQSSPMPRGENRVLWDGQTDFGRMALNGRYLLHLQVSDISGTQEKLVPFVLVK